MWSGWYHPERWAWHAVHLSAPTIDDVDVAVDAADCHAPSAGEAAGRGEDGPGTAEGPAQDSRALEQEAELSEELSHGVLEGVDIFVF